MAQRSIKFFIIFALVLYRSIEFFINPKSSLGVGFGGALFRTCKMDLHGSCATPTHLAHDLLVVILAADCAAQIDVNVLSSPVAHAHGCAKWHSANPRGDGESPYRAQERS